MKNKIKKCAKCGKSYPSSLEYFCTRNASKDGFSSKCKTCCQKYRKEFYKKNKTAILKTNKNYRYNNKEKIKIIKKNYSKNHAKEEREYRHKYNLEHKKERREYDKKRHIDHKDEIRENKQKYYIKNKEKIKKQNKEYNFNNSEKIKNNKKKYGQEHKKEKNERNRNRRKTDVEYKIIGNLRNRLNIAIRSCNTKKSNPTLELIGCSVKELMEFLESKFLLGMTWDNYGKGDDKWNIDHIMPIAFFDIKNPEQQKKCFHYTNLQPLWQLDNLRKGSGLINK